MSFIWWFVSLFGVVPITIHKISAHFYIYDFMTKVITFLCGLQIRFEENNCSAQITMLTTLLIIFIEESDLIIDYLFPQVWISRKKFMTNFMLSSLNLIKVLGIPWLIMRENIDQYFNHCIVSRKKGAIKLSHGRTLIL